MQNYLRNTDTPTFSGTSMTSEVLYKKFWEWAELVFTDSYKQEVESYLSESIDFCDLEQRMKLLKVRGLF